MVGLSEGLKTGAEQLSSLGLEMCRQIKDCC